MKTSIDDALARLTAEQEHPGLAGIEERVLLAIAAHPVTGLPVGVALGSAALALTIGILGGGVSPATARSATLAPFGVPGPLAPSTLLLPSR